MKRANPQLAWLSWPSLIPRDPWRVLAGGTGLVLIAVLVVAFSALLYQSFPAWRSLGSSLITSPEWFFRHERFGAASMIYGSVVSAGLALLLALPVALGAAVWISEYTPPRVRWILKMLLESLAAVPSVVYGLIGVLVLRRWMGDWLEPLGAWSGDTLLTAAVLLAVMILPTLATVSEDALQNVSRQQREAARGLGLMRGEMVWTICLRQAAPGIVAGGLLGLGRALGETIAVFLVIGRMDNQFPEKLFSGTPLLEPAQTLTTKLGGAETHIAAGDPLHWGAMMALCLILLTITLLCAGLALLVERYLRTA